MSFPWSLMQNPSAAIMTADMYYLSCKTENSIQNLSWLLKQKETYLITALLPKNTNCWCKNNIFLK